jgi:putative peptidoglycan lipid II flippase
LRFSGVHIVPPTNQSATLEPQLIQWIQYLPGRTLSYLQRRRFEREAAARNTSLDSVPGMLSSAFRLALAAAVATALGLGARIVLLQFLPGMDLMIILLRAAVLCALGITIYLELARRFGVRDLDAMKRLLLRRLALQRRAS